MSLNRRNRSDVASDISTNHFTANLKAKTTRMSDIENATWSLSSATSRQLCQRSSNTSNGAVLQSDDRLNDLSFVVFNIPHHPRAGPGVAAAGCRGGAMLTLTWVQTMKLPLNAAAFHTLTLRRISTRVVDTMLREISDIVVTPRDKRCVQRLWSTLCLHEPLLMQLPFLPYLAAAVARCIPNNPVAAFESAMHFLLNMCAEWMHRYPSPPNSFIGRVDQQLRKLDPKLWEHLQCGGVFQCTTDDYMWLPLQTFFLYSFSESQWTEIFCDVVCRSDGMQYFYALAVSLLTIAYSNQLTQCDTREEVHKVVTSRVTDPKVVEKVRRHANTIALQLALPIEPIVDIPPAEDYYPILHVGRKPPVPVVVDKKLKLSQIEADEEELHRRLKVELSTLTATADVARFHRGVTLSDPAPSSFGGSNRQEASYWDAVAARRADHEGINLVANTTCEQSQACSAYHHPVPWSLTGESPREATSRGLAHNDTELLQLEKSSPSEGPRHEAGGGAFFMPKGHQLDLMDTCGSAAVREPSAVPSATNAGTPFDAALPNCEGAETTTIPAAVLTAAALLRAAERRSASGAHSVAASTPKALDLPAGSAAATAAQASRSASLGPTNSAQQQSSKPSTRSNSHNTPLHYLA